jgi:hypothetical protein
MHSCTDTQAVCRGCGRLLKGSPYFKGGRASVMRADGSYSHAAKVNYFGGWVCSRSCDYRASLELEQSMPGHGHDQKQPGREAMRQIESNWPEDERN